MADTILEMRHITKVFPGVRALDDVNFSVKRGEIHCLVGENGAGKSTLMKVLSGVYPHGSYEGEIYYDGEVQAFRGIADSEDKGIAIIYQELALVPALSIYENIFLGHEIMNGKRINWRETIVQSRKYLDMVGLDVDPSTPVGLLGVGQQQLVEIAKALSKDIRLLILDEPTSAINEEDSQNLLRLIRDLKTQGVTCIMISHKLREVIDIADAVTVLRDGKTICTVDRASGDINEPFIIRNMVGRSIDAIYPDRDYEPSDDVVFEVDNWTVYEPALERNILEDVSLKVHAGEIVGLQGLMGAGRTEFALSVFGNTPKYRLVSGTVKLDGQEHVWKTPGQAIESGVAYVSEDRKGKGLIEIQDVKFNISLANLTELLRGMRLDENKEIVMTEDYRKQLNIRTPSVEQLVVNLSGGNQQKVQVAKWLFSHPRLLIMDEPTRGIDVGAKYEIYNIMLELAAQGMGIIMISSELPEILGMSDRIYVMSEGRIAGELKGSEATEENVMKLAVSGRTRLPEGEVVG
ncbi:MAG: ATP-binding cassette domain-containing protein [Saccharofermentanales bacterium]